MTARGYCWYYLDHCSKTNHIAIKGVIVIFCDLSLLKRKTTRDTQDGRFNTTLLPHCTLGNNTIGYSIYYTASPEKQDNVTKSDTIIILTNTLATSSIGQQVFGLSLIVSKQLAMERLHALHQH